MTYLSFLILFVILPSVIMGILFRRFLTRFWWGCIGLLALIAVIWTTPWDNYLVANNVWWYDPRLVLGIVIGYVPLEEYSFFVLQTIFTGILLAGIIGFSRLPVGPLRALPWYIRVLPALPLLVLVGALLVSGNQRFNYLILSLGWLSLLPFTIQWVFGLDILLQRWRMMLLAILIPTLWLTAMDTIALAAGTWTIDPAQTVGIHLPGGIVPLEEGLFFLLTNTLIVQGLLLASAPESLARVTAWRSKLMGDNAKPRSELNRG
jgi:lycopene beta-cyclase